MKDSSLEGIQLKYSPGLWFQMGSVVFLSVALGIQALGRMVFTSLGITPHSPTWMYMLVLYGVLAIAGAAAGCRQWVRLGSPLDQRLMFISGVLSTLLLGSFWGGLWSYYDPKAAVLMALIAGAICSGMLLRRPWGLVQAAIAPLGVLTAYAFCSFAAIVASSLLTAHHWIGLVWLVVALVYLGLTLSAIAVTVKILRNYVTLQTKP